MGFWKTELGAIYYICILSFFTPVFSNKTTPSDPENTNHFLPLSSYQPYITIEKITNALRINQGKLKLMSIIILKITNQHTQVLSHINHNHKMMLPFEVRWHRLGAVTKKEKSSFLYKKITLSQNNIKIICIRPYQLVIILFRYTSRMLCYAAQIH